MIWRDDDIWRKTKLDELLAVDDCFQAAGVPHTIAVLAERLDEAPALVEAILARGMVVQLHGWNHDRALTDPATHGDLSRALDHLHRLFGRRPTTLYPPWNKSDARLEAVAAGLGITVSARKVSLEQYLRFRGSVGEDTVNFHYWDPHERELLPDALEVYRQWRRTMKPTDYCPRAAPFDVYLRDRRCLIGVEVGVDAGAHAEALLRHLDIAHLHLVDPWPKDYHLGFCEGRLSALGFRSRFTLHQRSSEQAAARFTPGSVDFVYCDEGRDADTVAANLARWWPVLKSGGLLGYRGYAAGYPVAAALDRWLAAHPDVKTHVEPGEELILVKP